jgi:putative NIF3 family GTP cyclohydrolase 1 type 2
MNTEEIMQIALARAGMNEVPPDSGIFVPSEDVEKVLFAIDVGTAELALAKELGCDLVIAHHPIGEALISFSKVVRRHFDFMIEHGVPRGTAEEAVRQLMERVEIRNHPANYMHTVRAARLLEMPLMNIHQPIDEITRQALLNKLRNSKTRKVGDIVRAFEELPEFKAAATKISVRVGSEENEAGRIALVFGAGTNGGYPVAKAYFDNGIGTVIYLHVDYDDVRRLREDGKGNLIVLGHMAGDSIGINVFNNELRSRGLEVTALDVIEP